MRKKVLDNGVLKLFEGSLFDEYAHQNGVEVRVGTATSFALAKPVLRSE